MVVNISPRMSVAEYLEWEERQELKHEYIDGEIIEMTGGTLQHTRIKSNIGGMLFTLLDFSTFILCNSDMRLRVSRTRYVYPDFSVVRGEPRMEDDKEVTLLNPVFVVEVTSPSSVMRDRVEKLDLYLEAPSIEAYLIVDQDRPRADLYSRSDDGWHLRIYGNAEDAIPLPAIECQLPLELVYRGIQFEEA